MTSGQLLYFSYSEGSPPGISQCLTLQTAIYTIDWLTAVTLGGAYDGGRVSAASLDLVQWAVGLQQVAAAYSILLNVEVAAVPNQHRAGPCVQVPKPKTVDSE